MAWSTEFESLMPDGVRIKEFSSFSTDGYQVPTVTTGSTYKARAVRKQTMVRTFQGTEELSSLTIWIASTSTFDNPSLLQFFLNSSTSQIGPLMALESVPDEDGIHHLVAHFP